MPFNRAAFLLLVMSIFLFASQTLEAKVDFQLDYSNRYIWRGFDLNPDNHFVIQPSVNYAFPKSNWSVNLWHSVSAEDHNLNEIDLTFNYDFETSEDIAVSAGVVHYGWYWVDGFKQDTNTTVETYLSVGWPEASLSPTISLYHDCKNGNGLYAQLALSKSIALGKDRELEIESKIGYNQKQWISDSGLSDVSVTFSLPIKSGDATIKPFYGISWPLMSGINPGVAREHWLGISLAF